MHTVYVMKYDTTETTTTSRSNANEPKVYYPTSNPELEVNNFSEEELWSALTIYRQSQQRADLNRDEKLCEYARKRVQDHTRDFATKDPSEYPNPEKYPLDAHAGFAADADSGSAFEMTDKNKLAENLAYWPSATDPIHVIEWGWDTSTEGHRETQLSNEYSSACIAGQDGFYVAIFGD